MLHRRQELQEQSRTRVELLEKEIERRMDALIEAELSQGKSTFVFQVPNVFPLETCPALQAVIPGTKGEQIEAMENVFASYAAQGAFICPSQYPIASYEKGLNQVVLELVEPQATYGFPE